MRKCWNWQTGMTKDHVVLHREGSSPFFRIGKRETERRQFWFRAVFYIRPDKNPVVWVCTVFGDMAQITKIIIFDYMIIFLFI